MAERKIAQSIAIEGEREYTQAVKNINSSQAVLRSEMLLATAQFEAQGKSIDGLSRKNEVLGKQIQSQKEKIATLREALQKSTEAYGESDKRTQNWQISLNRAEADLVKMESSVKSNTAEIKKMGEESSGMGTAAVNALEKIGISADSNLGRFAQKLDNVSASTMVWIGLAAKMVSAIYNITKESASAADEIMTLSSTTGLATKTIQELRYASEFVDVSFETLDGAMTKLIRSMDGARSGSEEQQEAFARLGVTYQNLVTGELRNAEETFYELVDALGQIDNETERDAISMTLFGKSARDLNPLIASGSKRLRELAYEANQMGYVLDESALAKLGAVDDQMQKFNLTTESLKNSLAMAFLPVLTQVFDFISKIPTQVLQVIAVTMGVLVPIMSVVKGVSSVVSIINSFNPAAWKTTLIILGVVAALILLAIAIAAVSGESEGMFRNIKSMGSLYGQMTTQTQNMAMRSMGPGQYNQAYGAATQTTQQVWQNANSSISETMPIDRVEHTYVIPATVPGYAAGTLYHPGGFAIVGEDGPELVDMPRGSRVYTSAQSRRMSAGGDVFMISIDPKNVREFNDIVKIAQGARQTRRARGR